jgi:hypothetical protein
MPAMLAVVAALSYAVIFYPGAMGFDGAYQWWQARGGETSNIHGVAMTWLFRLGDRLTPGPGPLFLLQLALFWSGIALIAQTPRVRSGWRMLFMLAVLMTPVWFVLFSFVASDVMLMSVLTCATGILLQAGIRHRRAWLVLTLALLFLALVLRKNALPAVVPLLVYLILMASGDAPASRRSFMRAVIIAVPFVALMQLGNWGLERKVDRQTTLFPATALWDLAAISLDTNTVLLPPASHGDGLTLDDLRQSFVTYANTTIFATTHAGMRQPFLAPDDPLNAQIWRAWIKAIFDHPRAYLAHRWRVTLALFGSKRREWPRELLYFDGEYQYGENPPIEPNTSTPHAWLMQAFDAVRDTVVFAAWPYAVLALIALAVAWRRRGEQQAQAALAVICSGLLYALPLPLISPSAELRYLGWTCLSAVIGAALAFTIPRLRTIPNAHHTTTKPGAIADRMARGS